MQPSPAAHKRGSGPVIATLVVVAVIVATALWVEAPVIWPPRPGHPVELLGINRTLAHKGSGSGYVSGMTESGCSACPLNISAGSTVSVNTTWIGGSPLGSDLHFIFINWTIRSPFPFLALAWQTDQPRPSVLTWTDSYEMGGAGGWFGVWLNLSIPLDSSGLPATGWIQVWYNATAY